ncbi:MAG: VOC family protein [Candidatus Macondimonas sp.]|jgi:catechol 2,3-dioxygenase-like lactoylglutathione lyase family enzyme
MDVPQRWASASPTIPAFAVRDLTKSIRFYEQALGLELAQLLDAGRRALLCHGDWQLLLAEERNPHPQSVQVQVAEAESLYRRCNAAGATVACYLRRAADGHRHFEIEDPDGHRLRIDEETMP